MRVYVTPGAGLSRAMDRVAYAMRRYAPPMISIVDHPTLADLVVLHTIGYPETVDTIKWLTAQGQRYAIIQYCLRTTQQPSTRQWAPLWSEADVVWSYYDLKAMCREDETIFEDVNFYISPLGADASVFQQGYGARTFTILTSGYVAETEGVREAAEAVHRVGGKQFHLGPNLNLNGTQTQYALGISDVALAKAYQSSQFVAGLRRCEGFEMPAAEGLLCGARPIMFDRPHYRRWFDGFAEFIPEGTVAEVTDSLEKLFRDGARPVTQAERMAASDYFSWESIVEGFWERVIA